MRLLCKLKRVLRINRKVRTYTKPKSEFKSQLWSSPPPSSLFLCEKRKDMLLKRSFEQICSFLIPHYSSTQSLARNKKRSKSHQNATTTSSLTIKSQIVILWRRGQKSTNRKFNHRYYTNAKTRRVPEINLRILHTAKRISNLCFRFLYFVLCYCYYYLPIHHHISILCYSSLHTFIWVELCSEWYCIGYRFLNWI